MEDVLIVGAGPTGLSAALTLAHRGIKARIIDKRKEPIATSNALAIQPRTLEIWEEMGLIIDALSEGYPLRGVSLNTSKKLLGKVIFDGLPTRYPFILALPQAKTEKLLAKHLSKLGVNVERGVSLETLSEDEEGVEATCNGESRRYSYVIGCDGAKSAVRELAGIPFEGYELTQHFIMADITIDWDRNPSEAQVFLAKDGPFVFFPFNDQGYGRIVIDVSSDERLKAATRPVFEDFKGLVAKRAEIKAVLHQPTWTSSFWIHCRLAGHYKRGRLFIAGDAAHLHSPFGGQGLNTGFQDAYFLAKRLADVLEGKNALKTLDEYEKVRRPIGKSIVRRAAMATKIVTTQSKIAQFLRNHAIPILLRIAPLRRKILMTLTQLVYR